MTGMLLFFETFHSIISNNVTWNYGYSFVKCWSINEKGSCHCIFFFKTFIFNFYFLSLQYIGFIIFDWNIRSYLIACLICVFPHHRLPQKPRKNRWIKRIQTVNFGSHVILAVETSALYLLVNFKLLFLSENWVGGEKDFCGFLYLPTAHSRVA